MNTLVLNAVSGETNISRQIYGHFSEHLGRCIYDGIWVGADSAIPNIRGIRSDISEALRHINIPNLRWPGGCFADEYHWRDGIGPYEDRPCMVNTHWGGVTEDNSFGTHEFMDLCEQLNCEPYICGNVGSGTVREMQQWIEYLTLDGKSPMADLRRANGREDPWHIRFWGVGNENWGCGGHMRPEYYADQFRHYSTYCRDFGENKLYKIACGPHSEDCQWTEVLMREAARFMNGLALHYYCGSGKKSNSATQFDEDDWFEQLKRAFHMEALVTKHSVIMDKYDPEKKVGLIIDEWGAWHGVEPGTNSRFLYQQNSLRDALVAGITLNIFNNHCDRVRMANIAQTVNVLQAMILTQGEKMILTPTYHVFEMYKVHQDATRLSVDFNCTNYQHGAEAIPAVSVSASRDSEGKVHVSLCNLHPEHETDVACELKGMETGSVRGRVLTAEHMTAHNTFDQAEVVKPATFTGARIEKERVFVQLPPKSVVVLEVE